MTSSISGHATVSRSRLLRDSSIVFALVLAVTVPFLGKAFHIDDVYYLEIARQILVDPLRPYDFSYVSEGRLRYVFENDWSPPFFNYVLALGLLLFGEDEVPLHIIMGAFTASVGVSTYFLALRFSERPLVAASLVLLNPLFVPGQNLMLDTPMLGLGLAGLACHVWGTDRRSIGLVLIGGLLTGLAVVTKYPAAIVLLMMSAYSALRRSWLIFPAWCVACIPIAAWSVQNIVVHGRVHFVEPIFGGGIVHWGEYVQRAVALLRILGSGFVFFLLAPRLTLSGRWRGNIFMGSLIIAGLWQVFQKQTNWQQAAQHAIFISSGAFLLVTTVMSSLGRSPPVAVARSDHLFLLLFLIAGWFAPIGSQFLAVRHVLWGIVPAAIVIARLPASRFSNAFLWFIVLGTGCIGLGTGGADFELANKQREMVRSVRNVLGEHDPTYFLGEDGFAYYSAISGFRALLADKTPDPPSAFILCSSATMWGLPPSLTPRLKKMRVLMKHGSLPMNTMSYGVNFYRTGNADLPWELGTRTQVYMNLYLLDLAEGIAD
jgi:Dolichyl-phosphate-mannose-protein mannosyltransferase